MDSFSKFTILSGNRNVTRLGEHICQNRKKTDRQRRLLWCEKTVKQVISARNGELCCRQVKRFVACFLEGSCYVRISMFDWGKKQKSRVSIPKLILTSENSSWHQEEWPENLCQNLIRDSIASGCEVEASSWPLFHKIFKSPRRSKNDTCAGHFFS